MSALKEHKQRLTTMSNDEFFRYIQAVIHEQYMSDDFDRKLIGNDLTECLTRLEANVR